MAETGDLGERVASLEKHMEHMATKERLERLRVWLLTTIIFAGLAFLSAIGSILFIVLKAASS